MRNNKLLNCWIFILKCFSSSQVLLPNIKRKAIRSQGTRVRNRFLLLPVERFLFFWNINSNPASRKQSWKTDTTHTSESSLKFAPKSRKDRCYLVVLCNCWCCSSKIFNLYESFQPPYCYFYFCISVRKWLKALDNVSLRSFWFKLAMFSLKYSYLFVSFNKYASIESCQKPVWINLYSYSPDDKPILTSNKNEIT